MSVQLGQGKGEVLSIPIGRAFIGYDNADGQFWNNESGVYKKYLGVSGESQDRSSVGFTHSDTLRLTYTQNRTRDFVATCSFKTSPNTSAGNSMKINYAVNGTVITTSYVMQVFKTGTDTAMFDVLIGHLTLAKNDYVEVWAAPQNAGSFEMAYVSASLEIKAL